MHVSDAERQIAEYATGPVRRFYLGYIKKLTGLGQDAAQDVYQDSLLTAWKQRGDIRTDAFRPYFTRIVTRKCFRVLEERRVRITGMAHEPQSYDPMPEVGIMIEQLLELATDAEREILVEWMECNRGESPRHMPSYRARENLAAAYRKKANEPLAREIREALCQNT